MILLIGLAVGVDYALFYVARCRQERQAGAGQRQALETTSRTSGRTVVISGSTVALAMAGMFVPGLKVLNGIAAGTIAVIFCAVAGSVTVLPAILTLLGPKIDAGRLRLPRRLRGRGWYWTPFAGGVLRRPAVAASLATALLLALAYPAVSLHIAQPSPIALTAPDDPALQTLAAIQRTFRWAEPILRFRSNGTITSWLPLFLFVILFGPSMDYHVFILGRIQEAVTGGEPARQAIRRSISRTADVITAAALVMVCVFALFGTLASLDLKQAGVGLAIAVLIDATVIPSRPSRLARSGRRAPW